METMNDFKEELDASLRELHVGDIVEGTVIGVNEEGAAVDLKSYTQGFIRAQDMSNDPTFSMMQDVHEGDEVKAKIIKMDNGDGNIALSRKAAIDVLAWDKLKEMMDKGLVKEDDPALLSVELTAPAVLQIARSDRQPQCEEDALESIEKHLHHFCDVYMEKLPQRSPCFPRV